MPIAQSRRLKLHGKMFLEFVQELLERVESLEHLSNQHDILLIGVMRDISNQRLLDYGTNIDSKDTEDI